MCAASPYLSFLLFIATFIALVTGYVGRAVDRARAACSKEYGIPVFLGRETNRDAVLAERVLVQEGVDERDVETVLRCRRQIRRVGLGIFLLTGFVFLAAADGVRSICS